MCACFEVRVDVGIFVPERLLTTGNAMFYYSTSLCTRHVNMQFFLHVLGYRKRIFKDSVCLITRFYSHTEYDKPLEC